MANEHLLETSNFKTTKKFSGTTSIAIKILEIIITPKGRHPLDPNFGIGIRSYIHEFNTYDTRIDIQRDLLRQIDAYLDLDEYIEVVVDTGKELHTSSNKKLLIINILIGKDSLISYTLTPNGSDVLYDFVVTSI
jgi:phage baseplate assembly protein W